MIFETILKRMLSYVASTFDKREGSVIHDSLAPAARISEELYADIATKYRNTYAGTADREGLILRAHDQQGISPTEATYAIRKGIFTPSTIEIPIGERFNYEDINFIVIEKLEDGVYSLQCEEAGTVGNYGEGSLLPIQYVKGLETAYLSGEVLIYGEDEEETEAFRARYFSNLPIHTQAGNKKYYQKLCDQYSGIGRSKVFARWNGPNTIKLSILSSENTKASDVLIEDFQNYIDPPEKTINDDPTVADYPQGRGMGDGEAIAGAIVTVTTATEIPINVEATVIYREGYDQPVGLEEAIKDYLLGLNYNRTVVSYVAISAILQNNEAIDLILDVTVNGGKTNIDLAEEEIAALGTINVQGE